MSAVDILARAWLAIAFVLAFATIRDTARRAASARRDLAAALHAERARLRGATALVSATERNR